MTCYIINRKADNFRTSGFTFAVAACIFLHSSAWVVYSICVFCRLSAVCASSTPSTFASAVLCLYWVVRCSVCVCVCSAIPMLGRPLLRLCLRLLCLCLCWVVRYSVCICVYFAYVCVGLSVAPSACAICVPGSSAPSAFSVPCPLRLYSLCLVYSICVYVCVCCAVPSAAPFASASTMPVPRPRLLWLVYYSCAWVVCSVYILCASSVASASASVSAELCLRLLLVVSALLIFF